VSDDRLILMPGDAFADPGAAALDAARLVVEQALPERAVTPSRRRR